MRLCKARLCKSQRGEYQTARGPAFKTGPVEGQEPLLQESAGKVRNPLDCRTLEVEKTHPYRTAALSKHRFAIHSQKAGPRNDQVL